jgi:hypothetical protein
VERLESARVKSAAVRRRLAMRTFYYFQSEKNPQLFAFADRRDGGALPPESGPWTLRRELGPDAEWRHPAHRAVVDAGVVNNGFFLWDEAVPASRPVIESDRVEGTRVFDRDGNHIGTIKRLLIEKVSGRVVYVDMTFGGFLGVGTHHHTIPWHKLSYDTGLGGYRTDITEEQAKGAPAFYPDDQVWPDRKHEERTLDYWRSMSV